MIDDKKIKSAAQGYCDATYGTLDEHPSIAEAFKQGVNWAIQQFLKRFMASHRRKPERNTPYLAQPLPASPFETLRPFETFSDSELWERYLKDKSVIRWLNIDDLLPKEGGKQ